MLDSFDQLTLGLDGEIFAPGTTFAARLRARVLAVEDNYRTQSHPQMRSTQMATPELIPYLSVSDARAAFDFYAEVFGAEQEEIFEMDDGRVGHITVKIGDRTMYMADEFPEQNFLGPDTRGGGTVALVIDVEDADATFDQAVGAGATSFSPVANQHGTRSGWFIDPWGHRWSPRSPEKG